MYNEKYSILVLQYLHSNQATYIPFGLMITVMIMIMIEPLSDNCNDNDNKLTHNS